MSTENKQNTGIKITLAALGAYFLGGGITNASPATEYIAQAFPDLNYSVISLVTTLPNLIVVPCSIISGAIAGTKVKIKPLLILAGILYASGGAMTCFFYSSMGLILFTRVLFGIGIGLATPLGFSVTYKLIADDNRRQTVAGWGSSVQNAVAMAGVFVAGWLCMINWNYTFLVYLTGAIGLIMVALFMPDIEKNSPVIEGGQKEKIKLPFMVFLFSAILMLYMVFVFPIYVNMSSIVVQGGIGDASTAGIILMFFTIGSILAGICYGALYKIFKRFIVPFSLFLAMFAFLIVYFGHSAIMLIIGTFLAGVTAVLMVPSIMAEINKRIKPNAVPLASGIMMAAMNLGGFIVSGYYAILEMLGVASPLIMMLISAVLLVALAVVSLAIMLVNKPAKQ